MMRNDRTIAACLWLSIVGAVLFVVSYCTGGNHTYEGLSLALAAAGLCGAGCGWAFCILPEERVVDERALRQARRDSEDLVILSSSKHELTRKNVLTRMLYTALGFFGVALAVPLRSLGPALGADAFHSKWRRGLRLQREDGTFVNANDLNVDSVVTVFPEGAVGDAEAQTVLIRLPSLIPGTANGFAAYSKVCTHAGCPVALYRAAAKQLYCPCHQSAFDVVGDGNVVSGPADRSLPRLPIEIRSDGYLYASGDFNAPVGPSFWERDT